MKLYKTTCFLPDSDEQKPDFTEYSSSDASASKARTRLKKLGLAKIKTVEVEVGTTRAALIQYLNEQTAHESCGVQS